MVVLFAVGVAGVGLIVIAAVVEVLAHPVIGLVAVTVYVWLIGEFVAFTAVVDPAAVEIAGEVFHDQL